MVEKHPRERKDKKGVEREREQREEVTGMSLMWLTPKRPILRKMIACVQVSFGVKKVRDLHEAYKWVRSTVTI